MSNFLEWFFNVFRGKNFFLILFENTIASALKSYIIPFFQKNFFFNFLNPKTWKTGFCRANTQISNLHVLHKGLLLQDWVFRLGLRTILKSWMHILRRTFDSNGYVTACRFLLFYFVLFLQAFNEALHTKYYENFK